MNQVKSQAKGVSKKGRTGRWLFWLGVRKAIRSWLTALSVIVLAVGPAPVLAGDALPFDARYRGHFTVTFLTGPGFTDELFFHGEGWANHLGRSTVDGYSQLGPGSPGCEEIRYDEVTLTAASGDGAVARELRGGLLRPVVRARQDPHPRRGYVCHCRRDRALRHRERQRRVRGRCRRYTWHRLRFGNVRPAVLRDHSQPVTG